MLATKDLIPLIEDLEPAPLNEMLLCADVDITQPDDVRRIVAIQAYGRATIILVDDRVKAKPDDQIAVLMNDSFDVVGSALARHGVVFRPLENTADHRQTFGNVANPSMDQLTL